MADSITLYRGADVDFAFTWRGGDNLPLNLTAYTVEVFEAHPDILGHVTAAITDPVLGRVGGRITWDSGMADGRVMNFRLRLVPLPSAVVPPPVRRPMPPIWVLVK